MQPMIMESKEPARNPYAGRRGIIRKFLETTSVKGVPKVRSKSYFLLKSNKDKHNSRRIFFECISFVFGWGFVALETCCFTILRAVQNHCKKPFSNNHLRPAKQNSFWVNCHERKHSACTWVCLAWVLYRLLSTRKHWDTLANVRFQFQEICVGIDWP